MNDRQREHDGQVERVSERVAAHAPMDPDLLAQIRALERLALDRTVQVATNGKFPHWTVERWMTVLTFITVIFGWFFFVGGQWGTVKSDISELKRAAVVLQENQGEMRGRQIAIGNQLDALAEEAARVQPADEYYRTHKPLPPRMERK